MATLSQVIDGLKRGRSYKRPLEDGGMEFISSAGSDEVTHIVSGKAHGGWGGVFSHSIDVLSNGRWPQDGWQPM